MKSMVTKDRKSVKQVTEISWEKTIEMKKGQS